MKLAKRLIVSIIVYQWNAKEKWYLCERESLHLYYFSNNSCMFQIHSEPLISPYLLLVLVLLLPLSASTFPVCMEGCLCLLSL